MSTPKFEPVDSDTQDLLSLIAEDPRIEEDYQRFLAACKHCADITLSGLVYVNKVRKILSNEHGLTIEPRRLSAFWNKATGPGRPMVKTGDWDICRGSESGNDGRPQPVRRWQG